MTTEQTLEAIEADLVEGEAAAVGLEETADACTSEQRPLATRLRMYAKIIRSLVRIARTSTMAATLNRATIVESRK